MAILDKIIAAKAKEFNALRKVYFPADSLLQLLKVSETTDDFEEIDALSTDWYLKYSEFRRTFRLSIARNSDDFTAKIVQATHVSVNDDIYIVKQADTLKPQGELPVWQLFCDRFFQQNQFSNLY